MSGYLPHRTADPVPPDGWETGRASFESLVAVIKKHGWSVEHDANMPMYGAYWILTPFGEFSGQGFGRADSLGIAYRAALAGMATT